MCRVIARFAVFEKFGSVLRVLEMFCASVTPFVNAKTTKTKKHRFLNIFPAFFPNIWKKGRGRYKNWRGVIDKPILELLTFGSNLDFSAFVSKTIHFGEFLIGKAKLSSRDQVGC